MAPSGSLAAQRRLVEALREPARYPHPARAVSVIETHISFVLLTGAWAYKIKKAVDLGFVDYTSLERRRFYCQEELRLNRRLAPRLYLGMVALGGTPDHPRWEDGGEPIEYAVKMAEFPQGDRLDQVLARGELTDRQLDALAAGVAAFHQAAPAAAAAEAYGSPAAVWAPVEANFAHLRAPGTGVDGPRLASLEAWSRAEHQRLGEAFSRRQAAGLVRECHGDLHLGNVALVGSEPVIFDCIEFSPALRWIDVMNDLAFLVMDLAERGRTDYAWRLLNGWLEGLGDYGGLEVLRFYQVYRALVRTKVACIRAADRQLPADRQQAARYLDYAATLTSPRPVGLLVTHGLSGSGKSTLARAVAQALGAVCLRSDVERKRLHGLPPLAASGSGIDSGLYGEEITLATYRHLAELAAGALAAGYPVVIDAACLRRWQRRLFLDLAGELGVPCLILHCDAPRGVLQQRLAARAASGSDASEASLAVLARQIRDAAPFSPGEQQAALAVDTVGDGLGRALEEIRRRILLES